MKSIEIKGSLRTDLGKKGTRELRKDNGVPCVLYGVQKDENGLPVATHFSVTVDGLRKLVYTPNIYLVNLDIEGTVVTAIMKAIQFIADEQGLPVSNTEEKETPIEEHSESLSESEIKIDIDF